MNIKRRLPAVEKSIKEIDADKDVRVRILGTVIGYGQSSLILDDGTGNIEVVFEERPSYVNQGQIIRVIARIIPLTEGFECRGEIVQLLDGIDINLYKQSKLIIGKSGV